MPALGKRPDDDRDDQFAGHQLTERQLSADDQPSAQTQQDGGRDDLQADGEGDLADDNAELILPRRQVFVGQAVGAIDRQRFATVDLEGGR